LASALNNAAFQIGGALRTAVVTPVVVSNANGRGSAIRAHRRLPVGLRRDEHLPGAGLLCAILGNGRRG
jgi:hypothetical protein